MRSLTRDTNVFFFAASAVFILILALSVASERYYLLGIPFALLLFHTGWTSFKWIFLLLIVTIPFSAEIQITETLGTDLPDELLMLLVSLLFFFHALNKPKQLTGASVQPLALVVLLSVVWMIVSALFSTYPLFSIKFILAKLWYICAFFGATIFVCDSRSALRQAGMTLAVSMLICTIIILIRHAALGFTFADINQAVEPFFRNHVNYSALLVCTIPIWYGCRNLTASSFYKRIIAVVLIVLLSALFLSFARGAWLALLIGMATGWLLIKKMILRTLFAGLVAIIIMIGWLTKDDNYLRFAPDYKTTIFHENFREHLQATYELKDLSAAERFYRWIAGVRMVPEHWLEGFGPGTFYHNYKPYAAPAFETWVSDNKEKSTVHNYFLLTTIEQGVPGLLILLVLVAMMFYYAQSLYHKANDVFYKTVCLVTGVIFSMILTLNFLSDLVETDKIGSLFFLCIAILVIIDIRTNANRTATG